MNCFCSVDALINLHSHTLELELLILIQILFANFCYTYLGLESVANEIEHAFWKSNLWRITWILIIEALFCGSNFIAAYQECIFQKLRQQIAFNIVFFRKTSKEFRLHFSRRIIFILILLKAISYTFKDYNDKDLSCFNVW